MLIDENNLEITCTQSHPGEFDYVATVQVPADLGELMPYINAVIKKPEYHPCIPMIIWWHNERRIAVRAHEIAIDALPDNEVADVEMRKTVRWINGLWERRDEITPESEPRTPPPLMSVLKQLPMNNCGDCGLPTCTAFAAGMINGENKISECPALTAAEGKGKADILREMGLD